MDEFETELGRSVRYFFTRIEKRMVSVDSI